MSISPAQAQSLATKAKPAVFWSDHPDSPEEAPALVGNRTADLAIVGGGFTGLWAGLQALEENPGRSVVILEANVTGFGASSRNGGFCDPSLTHGTGNGHTHWPGDMPALLRMGEANLAGIVDALRRYDMSTPWWKTREVSIATTDWQLADLAEGAELETEYEEANTLLDHDEMRAIADSPTYLGGLLGRSILLIDPARLVWDLRTAFESLGGIVHDNSKVLNTQEHDSSSLTVQTDGGSVVANRVIVATNAWAEPGRYMRHYVLPIYDHVLMTEPLDDEQYEALGWKSREGLADSANQFHYYRQTNDRRILWGGYDANYYFGNGMGPKYEDRIESHKLLAQHFFETFPQLEGLNFSHRWAGPIGTTSKFTAAFGTRHGGKLAWAAGYTGLGVGASRFGARVALDLVDGLQSERTELGMVRKKPVPIPPEPFRSAAVGLTRRALIRSDANNGKRGPLLKVLDAFGVGFDS